MVLHLAPRHRARAVFLMAAALPPAAWSQSAASPPRQTVVVTGNPLQRDDAGQAASVLAGDGLLVRRAGTLGETLDGLPGVASTWFGPNSSRPTIRGLDGDRVRLLDNGGASIDASSLSFDHAVALDPLVVERIEVLRGPAALLYGGNATGGVVNTIDNRIPRTALAGLGGRAELRVGGAAAERSLAALVEGGAGAWAWHADAFGRATSDLHVPRFVPREGDDALDASRRVRNSASDARGGAIGTSWIGSAGFLGLSADTWRNDYGVTVEPDVTIRMQRDRVAAAGEWNLSSGPVRQWSFNAVHTNYEHQEVEGSGEVGTTFRSRGSDLRVQARHAPVGPLVGVVGLQAEQLRFSALGEEAFVPDTRTRSLALFALEEWRAGPATLSAGLRAERVQVDSAGDSADAAPRFGAPQSRRFTPLSASFGAQWALGDGVSLQASLGRTQRAPAYYELYANGLHVATAAFEQGDPALGPETSRHVEIGAAWRRGHDSAKVQVFATRFSRFISLDATGREVDDGDGGTVPEYAFSAVRARLQGLELESRWRLAEQPWQLSMTAGADVVRGTNVDTGEPLPRLAPWRATLGIEASQGAWAVGAHVRHAAAQTRVPAGDRSTPSSTLLNLWLTHKQRLGGAAATWYARLDNATDTLAYNASTIVTLRGLAPLPGRALSAGVRVEF
jgi:iron complex outermembrane recepter protein